jgi:transcriptional regulator with XRE-family HTH domain
VRAIGKTISIARQEAGLSVPKLAAKAGLSTQTVYLIESGDAEGKIETLQKLAKPLGFVVHVELRRKK